MARFSKDKIVHPDTAAQHVSDWCDRNAQGNITYHAHNNGDVLDLHVDVKTPGGTISYMYVFAERQGDDDPWIIKMRHVCTHFIDLKDETHEVEIGPVAPDPSYKIEHLIMQALRLGYANNDDQKLIAELLKPFYYKARSMIQHVAHFSDTMEQARATLGYSSVVSVQNMLWKKRYA